MARGKFIVIDGIDGSGKATQTEILRQKLVENGYEVEVADFPQYGKKSASLVEMYLNGEFGTAEEVGPRRASIFYAADRYAASFQIKKWLDQGKIVISNRYVSANKGHQTSHLRTIEERREFVDWLNNLEYELFEIPIPDLTIFLHVPSEIGYDLVLKKAEREYIEGKKQDILEADKKHLKHAEKAYIEMVEGADPYENWVSIFCAEDNHILPINEISNKIFDLVSDKVMAQAVEKGFGTTEEEVVVAEKIVNIHSEISDAYSAFLSKNIAVEDGFNERLGDALQRIIHLAGIFNVNLEYIEENTNSCRISLDKTIAKLHKLTSAMWESYRFKDLDGFKENLISLSSELIKLAECHNVDMEKEINAKIKKNKGRTWDNENMNEKFAGNTREGSDK